MFNRNSFLQAFEPVVLEDLLQSDKSVLNLFKKKRPSDNDFKSVFSLTFQELSENLIDVLNKKHSAAFEMETIEGTRMVEDIQWETTTKTIDMSFADKMIESNDTHIYVVADDTKNTGIRDIKDNAGVDTFGGWTENKDGMQNISREMFVFPLIKAVQELSAKVKELESK